MKTMATFALGFGAGMVCLALVLWGTGSLPAGQVQAARAVPVTIPFEAPQINHGERKQPAAVPAAFVPPVTIPPVTIPPLPRDGCFQFCRAVVGDADRRGGPRYPAK